MWLGETPKNVAAAFRSAAEQNAVLFFDEADAIALRRSSGRATAHDREANLTINVLLRELEALNGIVIFATNLAANFDKAFERRIRTHVLFDMPAIDDRERFTMSGGDIKNAVIKAAAAAAGEPGAEIGKHIAQRHFEQAAEDVLAAKS